VLSEILPQRPLSATETGEAIVPIVDALAYLHGNGIVHGHLRPENILVAEDRVKLSSRRLHVSGQPAWDTAARQVYDAPETSSGPISPAADIWSLGATIVEALTQYPVWDRSVEGEPVVPASIPEPFRTIAQECLRTDPARRCTLSDIRALLQPLTPATSVTGAAIAEPVRTELVPIDPQVEANHVIAIPARHRLPAILAAAFFLVALTVTLLVHFHTVQPSAPSAGQPIQPATQPPLPRTSTLPPRAPIAANQTPAKVANTGGVAERAMPDLLPSAVQSIRGEVNVKVRVTVDAGGNVESASLDSPGPSKYFARMSLQAAQNWKFTPVRVDGKAVSSAWILHFRFTQAGSEVTPAQVAP
jgi:TonB family protein